MSYMLGQPAAAVQPPQARMGVSFPSDSSPVKPAISGNSQGVLRHWRRFSFCRPWVRRLPLLQTFQSVTSLSHLPPSRPRSMNPCPVVSAAAPEKKWEYIGMASEHWSE
jgi:hypothetical protein